MDLGTPKGESKLQKPGKPRGYDNGKCAPEAKYLYERKLADYEAKSKAIAEQEAADTSLDDGVYRDIKRKLVASGIPESEIAFAHDFNTDAKRKKRDTDCNSGKIRVLIGSTAKMGAGLNIQDRLAATHHLDCPWRPRDLEQRSGRMMRQGNGHKLGFKHLVESLGKVFHGEDKATPVRELRYVTKGSFDEYMWQGIAKKSKMIAQAKKGDVTGRTLQDDDSMVLTASQVQALASDNPLIKEKTEVDLRLDRLDGLKKAYDRTRYDLQQRIAGIPGQIEGCKSEIAKATKRAAIEGHLASAWNRLKWDRATEAGGKDRERPFSLTVKTPGGDKVFDDREGAGAALRLEHHRVSRGLSYGHEVEIGTYGEFSLRATPDPNKPGNFMMRVYGPGGEEGQMAKAGVIDVASTDAGVTSSLDYILRNSDSRAEEQNAIVAARQTTLGKLGEQEKPLRAELEREFEHGDEFQKLLKRQEEIGKQLQDNGEASKSMIADSDDEGEDEPVEKSLRSKQCASKRCEPSGKPFKPNAPVPSCVKAPSRGIRPHPRDSQ